MKIKISSKVDILKLTTEEESLRVKDDMHNEVGEVKYKCECGEIIEFYKLLKTRGKCPKCGAVLLKFSEIE
ncbi:MAG: hypothetical protein ACTSYM_13995 [Candidatus Baldrarchaeia archaeon]